MDGYLGEFPVELKATPFAGFTSAEWALLIIGRYGGIDGEHHKTWVIDQVVRILNDAPVHVVEARWENVSAVTGMRTGHQIEYRVTVGTCDAYTAWVKEQKDGEEGPETYGWDEGIAP